MSQLTYFSWIYPWCDQRWIHSHVSNVMIVCVGQITYHCVSFTRVLVSCAFFWVFNLCKCKCFTEGAAFSHLSPKILLFSPLHDQTAVQCFLKWVIFNEILHYQEFAPYSDPLKLVISAKFYLLLMAFILVKLGSVRFTVGFNLKGSLNLSESLIL